MERTQIFELMSELRLYGMKAAYDEIMAAGIKRQHEPPRILGDLLQAEVSEKQARSIKYQIRIAKLPLAKDIDDFDFSDAAINEALVRELASGGFVASQRNIVLIGGTGTGKTHLAIAIARSCIRAGLRGRFFNTVDLVNRLEAEARAGRQGGSPIISPAKTLPFSTNSAICPLLRPAGNCSSISSASSMSALRSSSRPIWPSVNGQVSSAMPR
jgi:DNA replication protein DnaC